MNIKNRLILMNFLQFFVWGSWLISLGGYLGGTLHFTGSQIGAVFSTLGIASLFMPALLGIVADKWMNAEKVLGLSHLIGAVMLLWASTVSEPNVFFWVMLLNSMFYMPTIALNNTVSYMILEKNPKIRNSNDVKKGDIIKVPNDYSQKMILYVDKKTYFPVLIKVYDEVGLFEQYDYSNLVFNPVFASDEFLKSNKKYNFK